MKHKLYGITILAFAAALAIFGLVRAGTPGGTGFTYQGFLKKDGSPVTGNYDLQFKLYDADTGGNQVGSTVIKASEPITNGLFRVGLDFGSSAFNGEARWLEIAVQFGGSGYTTLSPRQQLTSAPYALYAQNAASAPSSYYPLLEPQALYLGVQMGFNGGFSDGRYAYFVPHEDSSGNPSGLVKRLDVWNYTSGGVTTLNLGTVDTGGGTYHLKGFSGGFSSGSHAYFIPYTDVDDGSTFSGYAARVSLDNFDVAGVSFIDLAGAAGCDNCKGFQGGFTDGRYAYYVPFQYSDSGFSGVAARVKLGSFDLAHVTPLTLTEATGCTDCKGFVGGFTDGRYAYYVPNQYGVVARAALDSFDKDHVTALDLSTVTGCGANCTGFAGGFTDGRYGYLVPFQRGADFHGLVVRLDLNNFTASGVSVLDLETDVDANLIGFYGGFTDGRYGYLVPYSHSLATNNYLTRLDLQNFSTSGVTFINLADTTTSLGGFNGGFTDGRFAYLAPASTYQGSGAYYGNVARIQIFPGSGAGSP